MLLILCALALAGLLLHHAWTVGDELKQLHQRGATTDQVNMFLKEVSR